MKKYISFLFFCIVLFFLTASTSSCNRKTGCPANDPKNVHAKTGKNGEFKTKRGKSSLFPKDMKKKKKN